ncbi:MAG: hypothetical protein H8Z69_03505 [Nanohaloarchaea archaeon]|nr:hypothetical protein [Candidatus Nanohaloarchaea archaeon]
MDFNIDRKKVGVGFLIITFLASAAVAITAESQIETQNKQMNMSINVVESGSENTSVGVNADPNLDFGRTQLGTNITKFVNLDTGGNTAYLNVDVTGNISDGLEYKKNMKLEGQEQLRLHYKSTETGNYTGQLGLKIKMPEGSLGEAWHKFKTSIGL